MKTNDKPLRQLPETSTGTPIVLMVPNEVAQQLTDLPVMDQLTISVQLASMIPSAIKAVKQLQDNED